MNFDDFFEDPTVEDGLVLVRPTCPVHFIELPVTGVCEECS